VRAAARQAAQTSQEMNTLRQLSIAAMNNADATKYLPDDIRDRDGKPLLSWRVRLLPYLEENALYARFKLDEPWDSPNNRPLLDQMPAIYRTPSGGPANKTRFVGFKGEHTLFPPGGKMQFKRITDGTSNTLLFVEAPPEKAVEWTKPADIDFDPAKPFAGVESPRGFFLAAFADGSVQRLSFGLGDDAMKALVTADGGEPIDRNSLYQSPRAPQPPRVEADHRAAEPTPSTDQPPGRRPAPRAANFQGNVPAVPARR
jgi:hypothetical protein